MNISIFGLGYVGCVSMGCLAQNGHSVIGVDVAQSKIDLINQGRPTIIEQKIDEIMAEQFAKGRIKATRDYMQAVKDTEVSIVCVGTPSTAAGHLNLEYIHKVAEQIAEAIREKESFHIVVIRSTVLPGTNNKVGDIIEQVSGKQRNQGFTVISNPEFLREGSAVEDYYNPAVTVIGGNHQPSIEKVAELYELVDAPVEKTDIEIAEIIKYVNNTFHALKIVFANEVGNICKKLNIDSHQVMDLFCKDTQLNISNKYFKPGYAYGGSCLPKDLKGLRTIAHDNYLSVPVINAIEASNDYQQELAFQMIANKPSKQVSVLGLSFKSGTDDLRYSPAVELVEKLLGKGYTVSIFDENVNLTNITGTNKDYIDRHIPHLSEIISGDLQEVVSQGEIVVVTQQNPQFNALPEQYPDKEFIDFVRIGQHQGANVNGLCW
jgi:GDP-mannose 6-dehydrogenase